MRKIQILREARELLKTGNYAGICGAIEVVLKKNKIPYNVGTVFPLLLETAVERYRKTRDYMYGHYWWELYEFGLFSGRRRFMRWLMWEYRDDKEDF